MKSIASGLLVIMITGLCTTLWAFHRDITRNSVNIKNVESREKTKEDDIKYIRARIDRIYDHLISN